MRLGAKGEERFRSAAAGAPPHAARGQRCAGKATHCLSSPIGLVPLVTR